MATLAAVMAAGGALRLQAHGLAPKVIEATPVEGRVAKSPDGHFWADARVDGAAVRLLVDTGSSEVTLTMADARRIGLDPDRLAYRRRVFTAAGEGAAAEVMLKRVRIGGAAVEDVHALVMRRGLATSLLGMSYLGRLSRFEATPEAMVLRP